MRSFLHAQTRLTDGRHTLHSQNLEVEEQRENSGGNGSEARVS